MEDALASYDAFVEIMPIGVLILVLMEDALAHCAYSSF